MLLHPLKVQLQQLFTLDLTWRTTVMSVSTHKTLQPFALTTGLIFNAGENKCLPLNMYRCHGHSQVETKNGHKISLIPQHPKISISIRKQKSCFQLTKKLFSVIQIVPLILFPGWHNTFLLNSFGVHAGFDFEINVCPDCSFHFFLEDT